MGTPGHSNASACSGQAKTQLNRAAIVSGTVVCNFGAIWAAFGVSALVSYGFKMSRTTHFVGTRGLPQYADPAGPPVSTSESGHMRKSRLLPCTPEDLYMQHMQRCDLPTFVCAGVRALGGTHESIHHICAGRHDDLSVTDARRRGD